MPLFGPILKVADEMEILNSLVLVSSLPQARWDDLLGNERPQGFKYRQLLHLLDAHQRGVALSQIAKTSAIFSRVTAWHLLSGERRGSVANSIQRCFDFAERRLESMTLLTIHTVEPTLVVLMGCVVGMIVCGMFFPMLELVDFVFRQY